jgi:hypothetical protein
LYRGLSHAEQAVVDDLIAAEDLAPALHPYNQERQARILDTLIELIDYEEKLAASNPVKNHKERRFSVLSLRSKNPTKPLKAGTVYNVERPDLANASSRIGPFAGVTNSHQHFFQLEWRPALTGIASSDAGFASGLAIDFFKTILRLHPEQDNRLVLQEFDLLKIEAYSDVEWIIRPPSWSLNLSHVVVPTCAHHSLDGSSCQQTNLRFAAGYVLPLLSQHLVMGALAQSGFGTSTEYPGHMFGELTAIGLITVKASTNIKLHYLHHQRTQFYDNGVTKTFPDGQLELGMTPKQNHELRAGFTYNRKYADGMLGYFYFW